MKWIPIFAVLLLAGCSALPGVLGGVEIRTSNEADAMRACAALADVMTPGVSPQAVIELTRGAIGSSALGADPAAGLERCAKMIRQLAP